MSSVNELEKAVITALLAGPDSRFPPLRAQFASATVKSREFSEVGFFTELDVPLTAPRATPPNFELGSHLLLELKGVPNGAGVVLFVRQGALTMLEGYTFDGPWPANPVIVAIKGSDEGIDAPSA